MAKVKMQTPEQHAHAVVWLLAIVEDMIRTHEKETPSSHSGLCSLQAQCVQRVTRHKVPFDDYVQVRSSMEDLVRKHLRPRTAPAFWFGSTSNPAAYDRRTAALQKLRAIIASGDIDPR